MKKILYSTLLLAIFFFQSVQAILASDRNIFGLHLTQTSDIESASRVINTAGGDWGWITIVIRTDLLDRNQWQDFFDKCRRFHLIPIVRLGTRMENEYWKKPEHSDIDSLVSFLDSLNWPTQKKHIILFNEINHAREWGGTIDIKGYTDTAVYTIDQFKNRDRDYFILSSGLDLAAPDRMPDYKSAPSVYKEIYEYKPDYFHKIDGLASHSYPNHGFVGKPDETGQHSIKGYSWELEFIKSLGVSKTYPVFITETGWPHREGESRDNSFYTSKTTADFLMIAHTQWKNDPRVTAVTPFIYNYPYPPFDHFSWLDKNGDIYNDYQSFLNLPKMQNKPPQVTAYEFVKVKMPFLIFPDHEYQGEITLKNTGQSIWGEKELCLNPQTTPDIALDKICTQSGLTEPSQNHTFSFRFKINKDVFHAGKSFISWDNLPSFEVQPVPVLGNLYHPSTGLREKIKNILYRLLK